MMANAEIFKEPATTAKTALCFLLTTVNPIGFARSFRTPDHCTAF
jgi:hypothetical protein